MVLVFFGMIVIALVVLFIVVFVGFLMVIYFNEFAFHKLWQVVKLIFEIFVGVLTVVYGFFVILVVVLVLRGFG